MTVKPTFQGEVQFAGYADSSRGGPRITLRLADRDELEKFVGCEGKRYMAVFVEIGAGEEPVGTPAPSPAPAQAPRQRMAPLCEWAVMRAREPAFQGWAVAQYRRLHAGVFPDVGPEEVARLVVLELCEVESRKDLDASATAANRLHERVRKPYAAWLAQQQGVPA